MIKVLLVGPSNQFLSHLSEALARSGVLEIVGVGDCTDHTLERVRSLRPQVICADMEPPAAEALRFVEKLMETNPTPVLVISSEQIAPSEDLNRRVRLAGALELAHLPNVASEASVEALRSKIRVLAGVKVFSRKGSRRVEVVPAPTSSGSTVSGSVEPKLVAIGASTGGPQALASLLSALDADFPWPIVCVQHMTQGFLDNLIRWMSSQTTLKIHKAEHGQRLRPGCVYFAPEDRHLLVRPDLTVSLEHSQTVDGHRPSVTALFDSVARHFGRQAIGLLLTGMGGDGASGLLAMAQAGAATLVQDQASSVVFGMGQRALEMGTEAQVLPLDQLGPQLRKYAQRRAL